MMGLNVSPAVTMDDNMRLEIKCPVKSVNELLNNKRYDICREILSVFLPF